MKNRNLLNREYLKSFISFIRNKATTAEVANQPPRPQTAFVIFGLKLYCGHPSFKRRGEYYVLT
jgi:hypothetical protein